MNEAPDPITKPEFKFKQLCTLKVTPPGSTIDRAHALNLVSTSNQFGVVFVGTSSGIQCVPLSDVVELQATRPNNRGVIDNYKRRALNLGCQPSHVGVNCTGQLLAVVVYNQQVPVLQVYSVQSFGNQEVSKVAEVELSSSPNVRALDVQWNPAIANVIGCVLSDGSVVVFEFQPNGPPKKSLAPPSAQATCLCWSPKGKQIVLGSKTGQLTQHKPDLQAVKSYHPPPFQSGPVEIVSVHWISTPQFIVVYKEKTQDRSSVVLVNVPKTGQSFVNFDDLCFGTDTSRHEHYFIHIAAWNIIIVATGNGLETSVLHLENDKWVQWRQDEGAQASLPMHENNTDDVYAVGMALNTSATKPIPIGDGGAVVPPMPYFIFMSEQGALSIFHTMNLLKDVPEICSPPQELPKQFFSIPEAGEPASQPMPSSQPPVQQVKPFATLPGIGAGEGASPFGQPAKPGFSLQPLQMGSQPAPSPFQLSGTAPLPSFGSLSSQLGSQAQPFGQPPQPATTTATAKPANVPVPKSQSLFSLGSTALPQTSSPGLFGGFSGKIDTQAASSAPSGTLGLQLQSSMTPPSSSPLAQKESKPQAAAPSIAVSSAAASIVPPLQPLQSQPTPTPSKESLPPPGPPPVDDSMIKTEIAKEVESVKSLLTNFKFDSSAVDKLEKDKVTLPDIRVKLHDLEVFEDELRETTASEQAEVNALKIGLVEMMSCVENIKAKQRESVSQRYLDVLEMRELDPFLKKMLKNIEQTTLYVETKLKEATHHLNVTWEKQKEPGSLKNFDIPNMEAIYQIMAMNMKILAIQEARVGELQNRLTNALKLRKKTSSRISADSNLQRRSNWSYLDSSKQNTQLEKLADKLLQTRISSNNETVDSIKDASSQYIALANFRKELPKEKETALRKWLTSHKVICTKVARPAVPDNDILNRSFAKYTPVKSPTPITETPLVNPAKVVSRTLFPAHSETTSPVTSTPLVSKTDDMKFKEKSQFPVPSFESPVVTVKPAEQKMASSSPKNVFGSSFGFTKPKEPSLTGTPPSTSVNFSQLQTPAPKVEVSLFSTPTPLKPKSSPKTTVESPVVPEPKSSPLSTIKPLSSTSVSPSLPVTVAEKDKPTTTASTIFSGTGFAGFGAGFGSTLGSMATTTSTTATTKPPFFGATFGAGLSSATTMTAATTTSSPLALGNLSSSGQNLFSGTGFSFYQPAKTASSTNSGTTPSTVSVSFSTTTAAPTTAATISSGFVSSKPSSVFPSFGTALSSATPNVTVTSQPKTVPQSVVSSSSQQSAPTAATLVATTGPETTATAAAPTGASITSSTQPDKAATAAAAAVASAAASVAAATTTTEFSFSNLMLPPVSSTSSSPAPSSQPSTTTTSSIFGATAQSQSIFAAKTSQTFTPPTASTIVFGTAATTTPSTVFQTPPKSAATFTGGSLFGTPTTSSFGTPTSSAPSMGTATTSAPSVFGTATAFGTPTTSAPPAFGTPTSSQPTFGTPTSSASVFGAPTTSAPPAFGSPSTAQSQFGQAASPAFPATTTPTSVFGTPTTTSANIFGAVNALANTSFFGSPTTTASGFGTQTGSLFGGTSSFSTPSTSSSNIFGAKICSPDAAQNTPNTSNPFGSPFGQKTATPGATFAGTPFGSFRPSTPGTFGSSGGSLFGGNGSTFGQTPQQGGLFQSAGSSPNVFGAATQSPGAFSSGGQSGFGGFGAPQQQQPRPFGASGGSVFGGQAAFGSAPTFGGTATFGGSPTKGFGTAAPAPAFGAPTQQSSTFENLAAQNTVSFGNLAQTSPTFGGGTTFGQTQAQPQQQQQQQQQPSAFSNTPAFGGSSFSSWR